MAQVWLIFGGVNVVILALIAWLGKLWLKRILIRETHKLNTDLESFKSNLTSSASRDVERLKTELAIQAKRSEKEHSTIFDKQVEVIDFMYKSLVNISAQASKSLWFIECPRHPDGIRKEASKLHDEINNLNRYFVQNKIYIDAETCETIADAIEKASKPAAQYVCYLGNYDDHELHTIQDVRDRSWDTICQELHPAIQIVENRFREQFLYHRNS